MHAKRSTYQNCRTGQSNCIFKPANLYPLYIARPKILYTELQGLKRDASYVTPQRRVPSTIQKHRGYTSFRLNNFMPRKINNYCQMKEKLPLFFSDSSQDSAYVYKVESVKGADKVIAILFSCIFSPASQRCDDSGLLYVTF